MAAIIEPPAREMNDDISDNLGMPGHGLKHRFPHRRDDIGAPDRFDVYYGMADSRFGVARLDLPDSLPTGGVAAQPAGKV